MDVVEQLEQALRARARSTDELLLQARSAGAADRDEALGRLAAHLAADAAVRRALAARHPELEPALGAPAPLETIADVLAVVDDLGTASPSWSSNVRRLAEVVPVPEPGPVDTGPEPARDALRVVRAGEAVESSLDGRAGCGDFRRLVQRSRRALSARLGPTRRSGG